MYQVSLIEKEEGKIVRITQYWHTFTGVDIKEFYKVFKDGVWYKVCNDSLATAEDFLMGIDSYQVSPMDSGELRWFRKYTARKCSEVWDIVTGNI